MIPQEIEYIDIVLSEMEGIMCRLQRLWVVFLLFYHRP